MKIPAFVLLLLGLLAACQPAEDLPPAPPTDQRFTTSDPSRLYFNNIRSTAYRVTEFSKRYTKQYTLAQWPDTSSAPFLVLSIIDYWLHDQAYVDLEWRGLDQSVELPWTILLQNGTTQDSLTLTSKRWGEQYEFANQLNQALLKTATQLQLLQTDSQTVNIMVNEEEKRLFRLSWKDYTGLVDKTNKNH